jgi:hypothetical protein
MHARPAPTTRPPPKAPPIVPYTCTKPPPPTTGVSNPKCYAACLRDCDSTVSKEHYLSESLLEELGPILRVTSPQLGFEEKELRPASLKAKILCKRHNEALSGLDAKARDYFRCLRDAEARLTAGGGTDYFNGYDFERWLLKAFCGYIRLDGDNVPELWVRILFCQNDILAPRGLNMIVRVGDKMDRPSSVVFETARTMEGERVGCSITMLGFRYLLSLDGRRLGGMEDLGKQSLWRPAHIRWDHAVTGAEYTLGFAWFPGAQGDGVRMTYTPTDGS